MSAVSEFPIKRKDPDSVIDFGLDWSEWLNTGDTVSSATWTVTSPSGDLDPIAVDSSNVSGAICTAVTSGGTAGNKYELKCRVTTTNGLTEDRTIIVECGES